MKPTLSVIMSNYNHAPYIGKALEAILSQSYRPKEVIVIDDASTDDSVEIIQRFVNSDRIVRLLRNERNEGSIYNANRLLRISSGDYFYSAAADDQVLPGFFEKSISLMASYPQAGLCCSDPVSLDEKTGIIRYDKLRWNDKPSYFSPEVLARTLRGGFIPGHTSIVRRSCLLEIGGFASELRWHADWFASLVVAFRYGICYIPEPLSLYRMVPGSFSVAGIRNRRLQHDVLKKLFSLLKSPEYRNVFPFFIRGNVMHHFGREGVRVAIDNPQCWDTRSFMLIRREIWSEIRRYLSFITPAPVKDIYRYIRNFVFAKNCVIKLS